MTGEDVTARRERILTGAAMKRAMMARLLTALSDNRVQDQNSKVAPFAGAAGFLRTKFLELRGIGASTIIVTH